MAIDPITGYTVDDEHGGADSGVVTNRRVYAEPAGGPGADLIAEARANNAILKWDSSTGTYTQVPMSDKDALANELDKRNAPPTNPFTDINGTLDSVDPNIRSPIVPPPPPRQPITPRVATTTLPASRAGFTDETPPVTSAKVLPHSALVTPPTIDTNNRPDLSPFVGPPQAPAQPGDQAPDVHRDKIDEILGGLDSYQNKILDLAEDNTGQSVAEAQLMKADQLAKIRARDELAANQAGALGQARSARNAGDRALLERQAVGEQAYLGSQAQREGTLQQAELEGNLAILRATEDEHDRQFRLDAISKAADLGLNRAALEVDISKADLASANNWINNEAQSALANNALDEQQYEALLNFSSQHTAQLLGFTRDMAAIQFQYDQLSVQDQQAADALLVQKYGIDQQTMVALKQIKQAGKFKWDQVLTALVGGAGSGATAAIVAGA